MTQAAVTTFARTVRLLINNSEDYLLHPFNWINIELIYFNVMKKAWIFT
jgi:hypothetical protein